MKDIINIFVIAPSQTKLIETFYKNVHKLMHDGYSILVHDTTPLIQMIKNFNNDFQFRLLVHMEFKGKQLNEIHEAAGWNEMRPLKEAFPNGEFVFFTREVEIFPNRGKIVETVEHDGYKILYGSLMTYQRFFSDVPINVRGSLAVSVELGQDVAPTTSQKSIKAKEIKERGSYDVVILTVILKEFEAIKEVFSFAKKSSPTYNIDGLRLWSKTISQKDKSKINILAGMIGTPGNLSSYLEADAVLKKNNVDLMVLCGIAAGSKETGTHIYSVAVADTVTYYENQKLKSESTTSYRLKPIPIQPKLEKDLPFIQERLPKLKEQMLRLAEKPPYAKRDFNKKEWIDAKWIDKINITSGNILSGEKLLADGISFGKLADVVQISKHAVSAEMEGYGFAKACLHNYQSRFMIFRGISDYGGAEKSDPLTDKYQYLAANAAAITLKEYLINIYQPEKK